MSQENVAEAVTHVLAERGWTLGTIECATDGAVSRRLFDTDDGPAVLSDSVNVETVEDAIDLLSLPDQQFKAMGSFSPKAARAAARAGLAFLDVTWCLVVWTEPLPSAEATRPGGTVTETAYLTLNTGGEILEEAVHYDGSAAEMHDWLAQRAMLFVQRAL
ncbi:MAG: CinA family protein [Anaerolineae bacterium]